MSNHGVYGLRYDLKKIHLGFASTDTKDDEILQGLCETAARMFDGTCKRGRFAFVPQYTTRYYDFPPDHALLKLDRDLLEVSSFTTNNDNTTVTSDNYYTMRGDSYNLAPYDRLALKSDGAQTNLLYSGTVQKSQKVIAWWGYHEDWANAWQDSQDTTENDPLTAAGTSITVNDGDGADLYGNTPRFKVGQLLKIETEYAYLTGISSNTLTVIRGVNGTTAAAHDQNTTIYIYRPMADIEQACLRLAHWLYGQKDQGYHNIVRTLGAGTIEIPATAPLDVLATAAQYTKRSY